MQRDKKTDRQADRHTFILMHNLFVIKGTQLVLGSAAHYFDDPRTQRSDGPRTVGKICHFIASKYDIVRHLNLRHSLRSYRCIQSTRLMTVGARSREQARVESLD